MKGQSAVMEYAILLIVMMVMIFFVIIMIFGWQILSAGSDVAEYTEAKALFLLKSFVIHPVLTSESFSGGSVFDDSKLTSFTECAEYQAIFAGDWYAEVRRVLDDSHCNGIMQIWKANECRAAVAAKADLICTEENYPDCGKWVICESEKKRRMTYRNLPVNVYNKVNGTIGAAVLEIGVAVEE